MLQVHVIIQHFHDHKKKERKKEEDWIFFVKHICKKLAVFKTDIVYDIILNTIFKFNILQFMTGKHYDLRRP